MALGYEVHEAYDGKASRDRKVHPGLYLEDSPGLFGIGEHLVNKGKATRVELTDRDEKTIRERENRPALMVDEPGAMRQSSPLPNETYYGLGADAGLGAPPARNEDEGWDGVSDPLAHNPNPANVVGQPTGERTRRPVRDSAGELHPHLSQVEAEGAGLPEPKPGLHQDLDGVKDPATNDVVGGVGELRPDRGMATQDPNPEEHPETKRENEGLDGEPSEAPPSKDAAELAAESEPEETESERAEREAYEDKLLAEKEAAKAKAKSAATPAPRRRAATPKTDKKK